MTDDREHQTIRARVLALASGVLDDDRAAQVRAHLDTCADCAALLESLSDEAGTSFEAGHVPATMIAQWPLVEPQLAGLERELVLHHLARCSDCREDLSRLGHALPGDIGRAAPADRRPAARRDFRVLALGAWATLATAAAIALVVLPGRREAVTSAPPPTRPVTPAAKPSSSLPPRDPALYDLPAAIALRSVLRGASDVAPSGRPDPTGQRMTLTLPSQEFRPGEVAHVTMEVGPEGSPATITRRESPAAFSSRRTLVLDAGAGRWAAGRYVLRLTIHPGPRALVAKPEVREFRFEIVRI